MKASIEVTIIDEEADLIIKNVELEGSINRGDCIDYPYGSTSYRHYLPDEVEEVIWDKTQYTDEQNQAISRFITENFAYVNSKLLAA